MSTPLKVSHFNRDTQLVLNWYKSLNTNTETRKRDEHSEGNAEGRASGAETATPIKGFHDRLKTVRTSLSKTQPEMDAVLSIGKRSWQRYESEGQIPGSKVVAGLVRLGFNANWILTGKGSMRQFHAPDPSDPPEGTMHVSAPAASEAIAYMGLYANWLESLEIKGHDLVTLKMPDDGMYPTIAPGGILVIDSGREEVDQFGVWALQTSASTIVARAQPQPGNKLLLRHDNRLYKEMLVEAAMVTVIGKVIWIGTSA